MSSEGLDYAGYLAARDERQQSLNQALGQCLSAKHQSLLFITLNIPGANKTPLGSELLFSRLRDQLLTNFSGPLKFLRESQDMLGTYAIIGLNIAPITAKAKCIALENARPAARLLDLDIYSPNGTQISRSSLGLSPRRCFVCPESAVDCIRTKRHSMDEVLKVVDNLLAPFRT